MCEKDLRIRRLMDARGLRPTPFAQEIGVKTSTVFSIYKGKTHFDNIRVGTFSSIAKGLDMSVDELLTGRRPDGLSDDEAKLVRYFRSASESGRWGILGAARSISEQSPRDVPEDG